MFKQINEPVPQLILGLLLMLSLFMSEAWVLGNAPDSTNDGLYATLTAVFVIFMLEGIILCVVQEGYLFSFFFWFDLIGTLSIMLDIGWISGLFIPSGAVSRSGSVLRATRAAKLGARYGRLLRMLRLMRFTRFLPCFQSGAEQTFEPTMSAIKRVSEQLSAGVSLRTAALVMILVIVVPFLSYTVIDFSPTAWIDNMKDVAKDSSTRRSDLADIAGQCRRFYEQKDDGLLSVKIESPWVEDPLKQDHHTRSPLRAGNIVEYRSSYFVDNEDLRNGNDASKNWLDNRNSKGRDSETGKTEFKVLLRIDKTVENQRNALFGIILILMVIFLLFTFTASFSSQVNQLVVQPLERMMKTLRNSAMLMLNSLKDVETLKKEEEEEEEAKKEKGDSNEDDDEDDADMETAMLEKMVEKLARIVKHVLPGNDEIVVDANIDKNTSSWLSQQYTANAGNLFFSRNTTIANFAKDQDVEMARLKAIEDALTIVSKETINSWEFNVLDFSNDELCEAVVYLLSTLDLLNVFNVDMEVLRTFLTTISGKYVNTNTYHNFKHGCDVCHTSYRLLLIPQLHVVFTDLEVFSVLIGALAHDVGHPGINNAFLVSTQHELALVHNDRSPLENMHCVVLYETLSKDSMNIFSGLSAADRKGARKIILTVILGTDMSHHFEQISKTQVLISMHPALVILMGLLYLLMWVFVILCFWYHSCFTS